MTDTPLLQHKEEGLDAVLDQGPSDAEFTIYVDGGGSDGDFGVAAVVIDAKGQHVIEHAKRVVASTNNEAEYRALLYGINLAHLVGARRPHFVSDSQLMVHQVGGWWAITETNPELARLHRIASSRLMDFDEFSIQHVKREKNKRADWLVSKLLGHSRTLKNPPSAGIEFRTGKTRPGWNGIPHKSSSTNVFKSGIGAL